MNPEHLRYYYTKTPDIKKRNEYLLDLTENVSNFYRSLQIHDIIMYTMSCDSVVVKIPLVTFKYSKIIKWINVPITIDASEGINGIIIQLRIYENILISDNWYIKYETVLKNLRESIINTQCLHPNISRIVSDYLMLSVPEDKFADYC